MGDSVLWQFRPWQMAKVVQPSSSHFSQTKLLPTLLVVVLVSGTQTSSQNNRTISVFVSPRRLFDLLSPRPSCSRHHSWCEWRSLVRRRAVLLLKLLLAEHDSSQTVLPLLHTCNCHFWQLQVMSNAACCHREAFYCTCTSINYLIICCC